MKRVWFVADARTVGGAEVYLERLALGLSGWDPAFLLPRRETLGAWRDCLVSRGLAVREYGPGPGGWWQAARQARSGCDLVHVNLPSTYDGGQGVLPWILARGSGKPVVTTEHLTELGRSRRRRLLKRLTAGAVAATITVSEASRRRLIGEGLSPQRVVCVPNGVPDPGPPDPFPPTAEGIRIGVLASLEPRKQIDVLIRAAADAPRNLILHLAGSGPLRKELESLAASLGLGPDRVRFVGRVDDPYRFLAGCHVLALPSRLEGMPLSILEAKAAGRGVFASALPGMDEIVHDGVDGRLLPSGDVTAWTGALTEAAVDPAHLLRWACAAREDFEEHYTAEAWVGATAALYARVLGSVR